jgi:hypothetical protein
MVGRVRFELATFGLSYVLGYSSSESFVIFELEKYPRSSCIAPTCFWYCVHQTLPVTPESMEAGVTDHVWEIEEIVGLLNLREN